MAIHGKSKCALSARFAGGIVWVAGVRLAIVALCIAAAILRLLMGINVLRTCRNG